VDSSVSEAQGFSDRLLLVLNGRAGGVEAEAEYWLELIQGAGEHSRVLVVLNKNDEHPFDVNRGLLEEKFKNICGFIKTDCKTGLGIEKLKRAIETETAKLEGVHLSFPASWFQLKERVSGMKEAFLTFEGFQKLCGEYEIEETDQDFLADVLNALGIALNFRKDAFLQNTHILNPRWVTGGVYAILYAPKVRNAKGVMKFADLQTILDAKEYPPHMHGFLMRLMQRFELCFHYPNDHDTYLIPELLPENQWDEVQAFKPEDCLNFEYHYSVLPEGLVPRFIVRTHDQSEGEPRWRTGVILNAEGCRALVRADVLGKKILVRISGNELARRRVLSIIRSHFKAIHQAVKLKAEEMVPIPGKPAAAVSYLELEMHEQQGIPAYTKLIDGKIEKLNVQELLDGVRLPVTDLRRELLTKVSKLTEPQFTAFLELIEVPSRFLPSDKNSVAERAAALFQWIRQQETIPLEDVAKALEAVTRES
jgi:internalin A